MKHLFQFFGFYGSIAFIVGCSTNAMPGAELNVLAKTAPKIFNEHWYQGAAEVTSYHLEQARYGEVHKGQAVLIFVTEEVSRAKHIKLDDPSTAGNDAVPVLKLNLTKSFNTGIYPYSMMQSVFTPVDREKNGNSLKVTASSQEWCGHTFSQVNRTKSGYDFELNSYFESEGVQKGTLKAERCEDELWNLIRIDPNLLPIGKDLQLIPGLLAQRLRHTEMTPAMATATLRAVPEEAHLQVYEVDYPEEKRSLSITFEKAFPHVIVGWEETYVSGWGEKAKTLTTRASRNKSMMIDYWTRHGVADAALRKELGLE